MAGSDTVAPRLFGTDGVRGVAGAYPLDASTVRRLGAALVRARDTTDAIGAEQARRDGVTPGHG